MTQNEKLATASKLKGEFIEGFGTVTSLMIAPKDISEYARFKEKVNRGGYDPAMVMFVNSEMGVMIGIELNRSITTTFNYADFADRFGFKFGLTD